MSTLPVSDSRKSREPLTERQQVVFEFLQLYMERYSRPPTWWEICDAFEFKSPNAAGMYINVLEQKGYLRRKKNGLQRANRGFELIP